MEIKLKFKDFSAPVKFLLKGLGLYLLWILIYELLIKPNHLIDPWLTDIVSSNSVAVLNSLGFETGQKIIDEGNLIFSGYNQLLHIAYICDGLILYVIFLIFLVAFPGRLLHKLWFVPAGFILIYVINLIRVVALVIIEIKAPEYLAFNHKYTFTILVYGFIFLLWYIWIRYFSPAGKKTQT